MKKILLVEDDPNLGILLQDYLQLKGKFDVVLCKDGDEGLRGEAVSLEQFDLERQLRRGVASVHVNIRPCSRFRRVVVEDLAEVEVLFRRALVDDLEPPPPILIRVMARGTVNDGAVALECPRREWYCGEEGAVQHDTLHCGCWGGGEGVCTYGGERIRRG